VSAAVPIHNNGAALQNNNRGVSRTSYSPPQQKRVDHSVVDQVLRYSIHDPIENAHTPPSSWYTDDNSKFHQYEKEAVFFRKNWVAVDIFPIPPAKGAAEAPPQSAEGVFFKTGTFLGQPYLLTRNSEGQLQAFYNVCTHAGSCLVGPWTKTTTNQQQHCHPKLNSNLVGQSTEGYLEQGKQSFFQCPYHGWQFDASGRLLKATSVKGIQNFRPKDFGLRRIPVQQVGPIVFMNFGSSDREGEAVSKQNDNNWFDISRNLFLDRLDRNGFDRDLSSNLELVKTKTYTVNCNWKVFVDNYGDGCYHCSYAHADLSSNIDEENYSTEILPPDLSIQHAPPSSSSSCSTSRNNLSRTATYDEQQRQQQERFGTKTAIYAQWYPNLMLNRYGPWLDMDLVSPLTATTCQIVKAWFLERSFMDSLPDRASSFIETSLQCSEQVHDEDVFLCENVQIGMQSRGFDQGRYVPSKQIATFNFHQRLARDLRTTAAIHEERAANL